MNQDAIFPPGIISARVPPPEPTPLIVTLHRFLNQASVLSKNQKLSRDRLQTWMSMVKSQLGKIYGKDGPQLAHFPSLPQDLSQTLLRTTLGQRTEHLRRIIEGLEGLIGATQTPLVGKRIFIGHGRSLLWCLVKDFISERLGLPCEEFNRTSVAGLTTVDRLSQMLNNACFAFMIMTAEDEHADATLHARENVIHEVGLFQGRLGPKRAIVLLESGCQEFSNIKGLSHIPFPSGQVSAAFEKMRQVLERERILRT